MEENDNIPSRHRKPKASCGDRRRNRFKNNDDEILPKWKIYMVVAAICLCFALLYPTVFSPMLNYLIFGGAKGGNGPFDHQSQQHPPSMMAQHQNQQQHRPPHPGAGMPPTPNQGKQILNNQQQQPSGGRGSFAWLLPFYTVGVIVFLLYTLFKTSFKGKKKKRERDLFDMDDTDAEENGDGREHKKLRSMKRRLRKTEAAMNSILAQLEMLSQMNLMGATTATDVNLPDTQDNEKMEEFQQILTEESTQQNVFAEGENGLGAEGKAAANTMDQRTNPKQLEQMLMTREIEAKLAKLKGLADRYKKRRQRVEDYYLEGEEEDEETNTEEESFGEGDEITGTDEESLVDDVDDEHLLPEGSGEGK